MTIYASSTIFMYLSYDGKLKTMVYGWINRCLRGECLQGENDEEIIEMELRSNVNRPPEHDNRDVELSLEDGISYL